MKEVNKVNIKKINDFDKSLDDLINCYRFDISSKADLRTAIVSGKNIFYVEAVLPDKRLKGCQQSFIII